jgi:hypothetical protein
MAGCKPASSVRKPMDERIPAVISSEAFSQLRLFAPHARRR